MRKIADILQWYPTELQLDVFRFLTNAYFPDVFQIDPNIGVSPSKAFAENRGSHSISDNNIADSEYDDVSDDDADTIEPLPIKETDPKSKNSAKKRSAPKTYYPDTSLNLKGDSTKESFKSFCAKFQDVTSNNVIFSTVSAYYLKDVMGFEKPTLEQIMTCHKEMKVKPYNDFRLTFRTAKQDGYLLLEGNSVVLTQVGINLVEHDLPRVNGATE